MHVSTFQRHTLCLYLLTVGMVYSTRVFSQESLNLKTKSSPQDRIIQLPSDSRHVLIIPHGYRHHSKTVDVLFNFHGHSKLVATSVRAAKLNCVVVSVNYSGLSSVYRKPFSQNPRLFSSILEEALKTLRDEEDFASNINWGRISISSFSAGFGAVREILKTQDHFERIEGIYMVDSLYCGYVGDGTKSVRHGDVHPGLMKDFLRFAQASAKGEKVMIITHCDGPTPGYASTRETANYLLEKLQLQPMPVDMVVELPPTMKLTGGKLRLYRKASRGGFSLFGSPGNNETDHGKHLSHMAYWLPLLPLAKQEIDP